jgi:hypothetical protein
MSFCLIALPLSLHIISTGSTFRFFLGGPPCHRVVRWEREDPFPICGMRCARRRCESNQIQGPDAALAWMFSQLPFVSGKNPHEVVSLSWPTNMEAQDLFPLTSSTYTFPTGTKVDVACFSQNRVVDIERTECPASFVNPNDPYHDRPCVKVLHGSTICLHP